MLAVTSTAALTGGSISNLNFLPGIMVAALLLNQVLPYHQAGGSRWLRCQVVAVTASTCRLRMGTVSGIFEKEISAVQDRSNAYGEVHEK